MSTATVDVNQAFATERASQIKEAYATRDRIQARLEQRKAEFDADVESGKLVPIGNGRYQVTGTGYDAGEVWTVQQPQAAGEVALILPQTGLDYVNGEAQLYSAVPAWHEVGNVIEGGTTDIKTVLEQGGIAWLVMQEPATYTWNGETRIVPDKFVNLRSDTGAALDVVGRIYQPIQPREQLLFLQELAERYDVPFESAGPLNGGKQVFVSMKVPNSIRVDVDGLNEEIQQFFGVVNDNTGNGKLRAVVSPWRPVCGNTNRFMLRDAVCSWGTRHTKGAAGRIEEAQRHLRLVNRYAEAFAAEETTLARSAMTLGEVENLIATLWDDNTDEELSARSANYENKRIDAIFERFGIESARVGRTAYAAENAITGYLDHDQPRRVKPANLAAARATAVMTGLDDDKKHKAHKLLMRLAA